MSRVYFHDSYLARIRAMAIAATAMYSFFERGTWYLCRRGSGPARYHLVGDATALRRRDSELGLLPTFRTLFGTNTLAYFRPGFHPDHMGFHRRRSPTWRVRRPPGPPRCRWCCTAGGRPRP